MNQTVKTKILIISDTHCAPLKERDGENRPSPPFISPLPAADLLIHCGDLTHNGRQGQYHQTLDMLKEINAPVKLVIAGNHDASLDKDFLLGHVAKDEIPRSWKESDSEEAALLRVNEARDFWLASDGRAKLEGVTFLEEGVHVIDLPNGARANVYASPYTPAFSDFAFPYRRNEDRFNSPSETLLDAKNIAGNPVPSFDSSQPPIDILITHGPPYGHLDNTKTGEAVGCHHLFRALERARPLIHCFGHIHEDWGAERITWTKDANKGPTFAKSLPRWLKALYKARRGETDYRIKKINVDHVDINIQHAAAVDLSAEGGQELKRGEESFLINAAIMDVGYRPTNAPWLIELDLPKST